METRICSICKKEFTPVHFNQTRCPGPHFKQCPICGKDIPWTEYDRCCSKECTQKKREATSIRVYGHAHPQASEQVKSKMRATFQKHYGVDYPGQDKAIRAKQVQSYRSHFGRNENPEGCDELRDRRRSTCMSKYGVINPMQSPEVHAKAVATCMEKYGVPNAGQNEAIQQKMRETMLSRYGVENCMQSEEIRERVRSHALAKYGVPCALQDPEVRMKSIQTNLERYGVPWYCMTDECKAASGKIVSKVNQAFAEKLLSSGFSVQLEFRLESYSFDFRVDDNVLIELDPTFTHNCAYNPFDISEKGLDRDYHIRKTQLAEKYGYRCIHIFDWDDWDKVINLLGSRNKQITYARNYTIDTDVSKAECDNLLNLFHLQSTCNGQSVRLGLRAADGTLVQVMTFGKPRYNVNYQYELLRLCSVSTVKIAGGAARLFKHFVTQYSPESIISYCDVAKFSGDVYPTLGFSLDHITHPNKVWFKEGKMITDNLLRQRGYDQLFNTNYGKGTSNEELMLQHHWFPIYDCGQRVFEWRNVACPTI